MAGEPVLREVIMAVKGGNIVGRSPADKIRIDILIIPAGQGVQILCPDKGSVILVEIRVCRNRYIKIILDFGQLYHACNFGRDRLFLQDFQILKAGAYNGGVAGNKVYFISHNGK